MQFRGFSLIPPRSRRRKGKKTSDSSAYVGATSAAQDAVQPNPVLAQAKSAAASSLSQTVSTAMPVQKEPPATRQGQWQMPAQEFEELQGKRRSHRSHQICPSCGATDTERRRRKLWEKAVFIFTSIRAYQCRICGADFYARRKKKD